MTRDDENDAATADRNLPGDYTVLDLLKDFGVRAGDERAQRQIAERAEKGGMTGGDAMVLEEWFADVERRKGIDSISAIVAKVMGRKSEWSALLPDARRFVDRRRARRQRDEPEDKQPSPYPNMPQGLGPFKGGTCVHGKKANESCSECQGGTGED